MATCRVFATLIKSGIPSTVAENEKTGVLERLFEEAVNRTLRLDPDALERLAELEGKTILLELAAEPEPLRCYVMPSAAGLRLARTYERLPDVTISGTPAVFLRQLFRGPAVSDALTIRGDAELGQRFQRILSRLAPDWEEGLARFVGDIAAHQLARLALGLRAWAEQAARALGADTAEYLQEEAFVAARREQVEAFLREVDRLRADVDRLEQRLQRIATGR